MDPEGTAKFREYLSTLRNGTLIEIKITRFRVEFVVLFEFVETQGQALQRKVIFGFNKPFAYSRSLHQHSYDFTDQADCTFGQLVGQKCVQTTLNDFTLELLFESGDRVLLHIEASDFEPFDFVVASGNQFETLDFQYVS